MNCSLKQYSLIFKPLDDELYSSFTKEPTAHNAGIDLYCKEDVEIPVGKMVLLKLGLAAKLMDCEEQNGYHYWLLPRSSISKKGLMMANSVGVIDKTYRGELMGAVVNVSDDVIKVVRGERLFQIVAPDMGWISKTKKVDELDRTLRGDGGFGSTG